MTTLALTVADALGAEIRSGRLAPGAKLPTEAALVMRYQVSRTVVREALSRLKSLGLVESRQGSGVYVRADGPVEPLRFDGDGGSREAVVQMVELRRALEAESAALAAQRRTPEDVAAIRAAVLALDAAVRDGRDGVDEDLRFHQSIAAAARNPFLDSTLAYLARFQRGGIRVTRANEARRADFAAQVRAEHRAIAEAIEAGDATRARKAAARHMSNAIRRILAADPVFWTEEGARLARALQSPARGGVSQR